VTRGFFAGTLRDEEGLIIREDDVIPALDPATGLLPVGRHVCTMAEVEAAFVSAPKFAASVTRPSIWADWQQAVAVLQSAVVVHAAWIGGSFTTDKVDPQDIDVTFLISVEDYAHRQPQDQRVVSPFTNAGQVKAVMRLQVDSFVVGWMAIPQPLPPGRDGVQDFYYRARGYWDDWWQRCRIAPAGTPPSATDASPRRGYLEVLFSDYP
jgi:hypothetical protein